MTYEEMAGELASMVRGAYADRERELWDALRPELRDAFTQTIRTAVEAETRELREAAQKARARLEKALDLKAPDDWHAVGLAAVELDEAIATINRALARKE